MLKEEYKIKLEKWSKSLNIAIETLNTQLREQYDIAKQRFVVKDKTLSEDELMERAFQLLYNKQKAQFLSSAIPFEGVIVAFDTPKDMWSKHRKSAFDKFLEAVEENDVEKVVLSKVVRLDGITVEEFNLIDDDIKRLSIAKDAIEAGYVIPLAPELTRENKVSKIAGQDIKRPEETQLQTIYGFGKPSNNEKADVRGFILQLQGLACKRSIPIGKPISFRAINGTKDDNTESYELKSNKTDFVLIKDDKLNTIIESKGLPSLIENFFGKYVVSASDIAEWNRQQSVPESFKNFVIIKSADVISMNLSPDQNGIVNLSIDTPTLNSEIGDNTITFCKGPATVPIDFAENSKIMLAGTPWLPQNSRREGEKPKIIFLFSGVFALPEWKVERVSFDPLTEDSVNVAKKESNKEEELW